MCKATDWSRVALLGLLMLGMASTIRAEEKAVGNFAPRRGWWHLLWGSSTPKPAPKPEKEAAKSEKPKVSALEQAMIIRNREEAALHRRWRVCDRMRQIALELQDKQLEQQADQLNERAWQIYVQRTSQFAVGQQLKNQDEQILTDRLSGSRDDDAARLLAKPGQGSIRGSARRRDASLLEGGRR